MPQNSDIGNKTGPIFIMGCQRSGTSALWKALCQHPNLRQQGPEDDGRPVETMKELWFLREFFLGRELNRVKPHAGTDIDKEFRIRFGKLVDQFCREKYAGPSGRWISAHPADGLYVDQILELYPDARVLYLIRHPQEVVWSSAHAPWLPEVTRKEFLEYARSGARWWRQFGKICVAIQEGKLGQRAMIVRHERMLSEPIVIAQEVLKHVGEMFHESVAHSLTQVINSSFLKNGVKNIFITRIYTQIARDKKFCEIITSEVGDLMQLFDYKDLSGKYKFRKNLGSPKNSREIPISPYEEIYQYLYAYFKRYPVRARWLYRLLHLGKNE